MDFEIYTKKNAPEASKPLLEATEEALGMVPNLLGILAESPPTLESYLNINNALEKTAFSPGEQQIVILAVSYENECHYCMAAHSAIARGQLNVDDKIVDALRNGDRIPDEKLDALVRFTRKIVNKRGFVSDEDTREFIQSGYSKQHVLEVILINALKTISNYTNHIAETPVDEAFASEKISFEKAEA